MDVWHKKYYKSPNSPLSNTKKAEWQIANGRWKIRAKSPKRTRE